MARSGGMSNKQMQQTKRAILEPRFAADLRRSADPGSERPATGQPVSVRTSSPLLPLALLAIAWLPVACGPPAAPPAGKRPGDCTPSLREVALPEFDSGLPYPFSEWTGYVLLVGCADRVRALTPAEEEKIVSATASVLRGTDDLEEAASERSAALRVAVRTGINNALDREVATDVWVSVWPAGAQ